MILDTGEKVIKEPRISNKMETVISIGMWVKNFLRLISSDLFLERGDKKNFSIFLNLIPRLSANPEKKLGIAQPVKT